MWELEDPSWGPLAVYGPVAEGSPNQPPLLVIHSVNAAASSAEMRTIYDDMGKERPTYGFDLPGFGRSYRGPGPYSPRVMTDALLAVATEVQRRHNAQPIDAIALSTACEFLARRHRAFGSLPHPRPHQSNWSSIAAVAATAPPAAPAARARRTRSCRCWPVGFDVRPAHPAIGRALLPQAHIRIKETIDEDLWKYCVQSAAAPGAKHAPLYFLSGYFFSGDITPIYEALTHPVWTVHGVRGDFVDYTGLSAVAQKPNWTVTELQTGALPHFEIEDDFMTRYREFLAAH